MPLLFPDDAIAIVDALIFASPEPVSVETICRVTGFERPEVEQLIEGLKQLYRRSGHGIEVVAVAGGYQLRTLPQYHHYIERLLNKNRERSLSKPALETLSIIAYRQPVTRAFIESIRGVNVDHLLATLLERGLIAEAGRADAPGRPLLYVTTAAFLELFGLSSIDDLPPLEESPSEETN